MWQPGFHSQAYHPPEPGRSNGPNTQMGEVRPQRGKRALLLETESEEPRVNGEQSWDSHRGQSWPFLDGHCERGREIVF